VGARCAVRSAVFSAVCFSLPVSFAEAAARAEKPAPPAIASSASANGKVGEMFSHRVISSDARATYRARNLPPEFSINFATGVISGVPISAKSFTIIVEASNEAGTHQQELRLDVARENPKK